MTEAEFLPLFDRYHNMVYRLALSCTRSPQDAEDAVQTVFLKLLDGRTQPMPGKEKAWLVGVGLPAPPSSLNRHSVALEKLKLPRCKNKRIKLFTPSELMIPLVTP